MSHRKADDRLYRKAEQIAQQLIDRGVPRAEAIAKVVAAIVGQADSSAENVVRSLLETQDKFLKQEHAVRREFESRLEADWSAAFDAFYVAAYCVAEAGDRYLDVHEAVAVRRKDAVFEVLAGLHARARRISFEIHRLLTGGFPLGALGRARTLHEMAVIASVIGEYGRAPASSDLAQRYLDHEVIDRFRYLEDHERHADAEAEPTLALEVASIRARRQSMIEKYGGAFRKNYGWAATLTPKGEPPTFHDLHEYAEMSELRSAYRLMCGEVHASALGLSLNLVEFDGGLVTLPGPTNVGFGDPGTLALASLGQITWAFFFSGRPDESLDLADLLALKTLGQLSDRFGPLADAAEQKVMEREAQQDRKAPPT